ncbi:epoxide hydrolase family protein [Parerythrobacter aestuarii]|uniref:epoxide hydrolase family protein n=1 Tax=Parerythrobacter aestuarii TaxID=3020909 RepID=UPI0024DE0F33|nr:epoxide hydrolase family protein [Parerythrobacter aestuarii]
MSDIRPFTLDVSQAEIDRLHRKIDDTRWPEPETVDDWSQGTPLADLQDLVAYWRDGYDWRACEAKLNNFGQFVTEIEGLDIHFLHIRSSQEDALPLVLTHGWPGSVREFFDVIPLLTEPAKGQAFHLVIPSLPGFGFSAKPVTTGWGVEKIALAWSALMKRLGYSRWVAQGGDWGSAVTTAIGAQAPEGCLGIHINMPIGRPGPDDLANPAPDEAKALKALQFYQDWDSGYSKQQSTRPQTVGYGLVDSPVGLAGWIFEKMYAWTDNAGSPFDALSKDAILDNIMLYWLPATGASAGRLYWESFSKFGEGEVAIPSGVSAFPKEIIPAPRKWAERRYTNLIYWNDVARGGHFAAWEQPELFVSELQGCFSKLR